MKIKSIKLRLMLGGLIWCGLVIVIVVFAFYVLYSHYQKETYYAGLIKNLKILRDFHNNNDMNTPIKVNSARGQIASYFEQGQFEKPYSAWFWQIRKQHGNVIVSKSLFDCELIEMTVHCPNSSKDIQANENNSELITTGTISPELEYRIYKFRGILNQNSRLIVSNFIEHSFLDAKFQYTVTGRYVGLEELSQDLFVILGICGLVLLVSTLVAILLSIKFAFRPVDIIRNNLIDMRQGKSESVIGEFPNEIKPLVDEFHSVFKHMNRLEVENLSHNLKTPLSVLINESTKNSTKLSDTVRRQTKIINQSIEHYLQRSQQHIEFDSVFNRVNLIQLFSKIDIQLESISKANQIKLNFECDASVWINTNKQELSEVLVELIINAIKYANTIVHITANVYGNNVVINVEDDGDGICKTKQDQVLSRGVRLENETRGTGIGLSASHNKVLRMQGSLLLKDSMLGGLRVVVTLPCIQS